MPSGGLSSNDRDFSHSSRLNFPDLFETFLFRQSFGTWLNQHPQLFSFNSLGPSCPVVAFTRNWVVDSLVQTLSLLSAYLHSCCSVVEIHQNRKNLSLSHFLGPSLPVVTFTRYSVVDSLVEILFIISLNDFGDTFYATKTK